MKQILIAILLIFTLTSCSIEAYPTTGDGYYGFPTYGLPTYGLYAYPRFFVPFDYDHHWFGDRD